MGIMPDERQYIADICREEMEEASRRILERLSKLEYQHSHLSADQFADVRRFYEDLAAKPWTEADEECLHSLEELSEAEIKAMLRDAYRRSPLDPVPSFAYLVGLARKHEPEAEATAIPLTNPDAISAAARESLANLLEKELSQATADIITRLHLEDAGATSLRERLEDAQGMIIGRFTPLV